MDALELRFRRVAHRRHARGRGRLFAAVDQAGFFRTGDNGDTWTEIPNGITPNAGWYSFAKTGSTLLGGTGAGTLYRSDNNGDLWTLSNTGLGLTSAFVILADPVTPTTVYAAGYHGVSKSTDSGQNWTLLNTGFSVAQTVLDIWKDDVNMLAGANAGIKRSTDSGDTWTAPITGLPTTGSFAAFNQLGSTLFVTNPFGVYKSVDHGATWTQSSTGLTGGPGALLVTGDLMFAGTSVGVCVSEDGGASWAPVNDGFPGNILVTELATDGTTLYAGTFKHGVWRRPLSTTPVLASLVSAEVFEGRVRVSWSVTSSRRVQIERRTPSSPWAQVASLAPDGLGYVRFEDIDIEPGSRYGYRLVLDGGVGVGETWIDVPANGALSLAPAGPNPTSGVPAIAFTIPAAGRIEVELFDLSGRRVGPTFTAEFAAGRHVLPLAALGRLASGVYGVRLGFGAEHRNARIVVTN